MTSLSACFIDVFNCVSFFETYLPAHATKTHVHIENIGYISWSHLRDMEFRNLLQLIVRIRKKQFSYFRNRFIMYY